MVSRRTLEFVVGVAVAGTVAGGLSLFLPSPYALAVALAAGTPSLVRTGSRFDRASYGAAKTGTEQVADAALAAGTALAVGLAVAYVAVSRGYDGPFAAGVVAVFGVLAGQAAFYARNAEYIE